MTLIARINKRTETHAVIKARTQTIDVTDTLHTMLEDTFLFIRVFRGKDIDFSQRVPYAYCGTTRKQDVQWIRFFRNPEK